MIRTIVAAWVLAASMPASACLFYSNYHPFKATVPSGYDWDAAPPARTLPAPRVTVEQIVRVPAEPADYYTRISRCMAGTARLRVEWPVADAPPLREVGFGFVVPKNGPIADEGGPQAATVEDGAMTFDLFLFEGPQSAAIDMDIEIEVYAVDAGGGRGPGTRVRLKAPPAEARKEE
ncbi:hypothetical protein IP92_01258 [Pseudoduganella flava]|uniref:Lipoprotein n=1 Tax=Pseudoduganella flava TaxID=871742 RepID=A0A562Q058_9BURK|nr:hypothetical protein [Pseudoduganella flava]QGZ38421.1 hypothetical protein GO485_04710 [Pseudoduganella flava]TWI50034.1 hypothetical protein IP92_01258 [Pseudoduganella flava]